MRRPDELQAWLVRGQVEISADPVEWMERELLNIAPERIREITIEKAGDKPVRVFKKEPNDKDFMLADLPKGAKLKSQLTSTPRWPSGCTCYRATRPSCSPRVSRI